MTEDNARRTQASAFYRTIYQDYNPKWNLTQSETQKDFTVPTYSEIGKKLPEFRKLEATLKNQLVNGKRNQEEDTQMEEIERLKKQIDRNAVVPQKFPVQPGEYKYPQHGLKIGSPIYMTTYMDVGRILPSQYEIQTRFYPLNNKFTNDFNGRTYNNSSLNTTVTRSKVHDQAGNFYS